jgi:hypothetical protein
MSSGGADEAAARLAGVAGYQEESAECFVRLASDALVHGLHRIRAVELLLEMEGHEQAGVDSLIRLAGDATLLGYSRMGAALMWGVVGHAARVSASR